MEIEDSGPDELPEVDAHEISNDDLLDVPVDLAQMEAVKASLDLISLQRYFLWADRMKRHAEESNTDHLEGYHPKVHAEPYRSYWYGGLYVVIEGWPKLGRSDPTIDGLLIDERHVGLLRRYRNGAFHYQTDYFDDRFFELWADKEAIPWIRRVHEAFRTWLRSHPETKDTP